MRERERETVTNCQQPPEACHGDIIKPCPELVITTDQRRKAWYGVEKKQPKQKKMTTITIVESKPTARILEDRDRNSG